MRRSLSFLIGSATAVLTAVAAAVAGELASEWHHVTTMEGARAMLIVFIYMPLGLVVGMIIGWLVARSGTSDTLRGAFERMGISSLVSLSLVAAVLGFSWLGADHAPTIDGKELVLEYEVRLPPGFPVRDSLEEREFRVGIVASSSDRYFSDVDFAHVATRDSFVVVPGRGRLLSRNRRSLSVNHGGWGENRPSQFVDLPLAPSPRRADFAWSPWLPLTKRMDLSEVPPREQAQARYRVQFADTTGQQP